MAYEIERKFRVKNDSFKAEAFAELPVTQAYLCSANYNSVRIRIKGDKGYITIKGARSVSGVTRFEWEKEINLEEARDLLKMCGPDRIEKTRYLIKSGSHTFEVDEFYGDNLGLTIAEVELDSEDEDFVKPDWLGDEVTGEVKYYNSMLILNPYKNW